MYNNKHYKIVINYLYNTSIFDEEYARVWNNLHNTTTLEIRTVCAFWFIAIILQVIYWNLMNLNVLNLSFRQYSSIMDKWNLYYLLHIMSFPITLSMREHVWFGGVITLLLDWVFVSQYLEIPRLNNVIRLMLFMNTLWLIHFNYFVFSLK